MGVKIPKPPFLVTVKIDDLFIRQTAGGKTVGFTGRNTFTITEVNGNWGKLKSGAGWIYITNPNYCTIHAVEKDYEKIGKLVDSCLSDIRKSESYKALLECLGG